MFCSSGQRPTLYALYSVELRVRPVSLLERGILMTPAALNLGLTCRQPSVASHESLNGNDRSCVSRKTIFHTQCDLGDLVSYLEWSPVRGVGRIARLANFL